MTPSTPPIKAAPGSVVVVRDEEWLVESVDQTLDGALLNVQGLSDLVRGTSASFYESLDTIEILDPRLTEAILQRQYLAHLVDRLARSPEDRAHPRTPLAAVGSADRDTFLGSLIELAESEAQRHLDTFLGTFSGLQDTTVAALRSWATPPNGPRSSGLAQTVLAASQAWASGRETLAHRRTGIMTALPDLEERAGHPAASDDDKRALRTAKAALNLVNRQLADVSSEYWIGVLSRTLKTQGLVISLPHTVTLEDGFALPSLEAAVLMGLRDQFGGAPSHIGVEVIKVLAPEGSGAVDALLLHDLVPGGTGYRADLQDPERMWSLLHGAWQKLSTCECAGEGRLACHRCLLPFAAPRQAPRVSRESARRHLRTILVGNREDDPAAHQVWMPQDKAAAPHPAESNLELHFRIAFIDLLKGLGATVRESPGPNGNIINATLGGSKWKLDPQVLMHGCKPDFVLTSSPNVPQVAIFTDGFMFHATNAPGRNRVADDAAKRANLRAAGIPVLAITFPDVDRYVNHKTPPEPPWFSAHHAQVIMQQFNYNAASLHTLLGGPFAWLASWIQQPASAPLGRLADALPFFLVGGPAAAQLSPTEELAPVAAALLRGEGWPSPSGTEASWWWQQGHLGALVRWRGVHAIDVALILDDRSEALDSDGYRADWEEWLRLANWLNLRAPSAHTEVLALSAIVEGASPVIDPTYPIGWAVVIGQSFGAEADLARRLAAIGVEAPDLVGEEIGSGLVAEFAWSRARIAVVFDARAAELAAEGWRLVAPDPEAIRVALAEDEG